MSNATEQVISLKTGYPVKVKRGNIIRPRGWGSDSRDLVVECVRANVIYARCVARGIMSPVFGSEAAKFCLVD